MPEAARTLVKSPPELWAEVSDPTALARHLSAFGDIRITRLEPEATVAWEGDRASGTVALEPTGWGTKVTVAAETVAPEAPEVPEEAPEAEQAPDEPQAQAADEAPAPAPTAEAPRRGFFARLLRRRPPAPVDEPAATADAPAAPKAAEAAEEPPAGATPTPPPVAETPEPVDTDAVLSEMLASLGAAHHRPFSRG
jgi:hypothetical protein